MWLKNPPRGTGIGCASKGLEEKYSHWTQCLARSTIEGWIISLYPLPETADGARNTEVEFKSRFHVSISQVVSHCASTLWLTSYKVYWSVNGCIGIHEILFSGSLSFIFPLVILLVTHNTEGWSIPLEACLKWPSAFPLKSVFNIAELEQNCTIKVSSKLAILQMLCKTLPYIPLICKLKPIEKKTLLY